MDAYQTLTNPVCGEIKVKGSRFIGHAGPVQNKDEAVSFLNRITRKYHDATHHCYAYRLGYGSQSSFRYSDAGEPTGTAGKPILKTIDGQSLCNVICVVVRYFGGTKLGTGGLSRAYASCAKQTLETGVIQTCFPTNQFQIKFDYNDTGQVMAVISNFQGEIVGSHYGTQTELVVQIQQSKASDFQNCLMDETRGKIQIHIEEVKDR